MRTLLALGAALCLAAAALPARADGPGDLQARARSLQLADDPAWADLLQYEPHPLTRRLRSLADDPGFFNAPDGASNPAAELDATLARLFDPARPDDPDSHPQCRFPARLHWLRTRLGMSTATLPAQPCPRLEAWMAEINPAGVTLVFPSAYVNSPASMFGHTLLRIDAVGQTEATRLLAYTINYAAKADASDGFSFALKGLTGLYPGMLSSSPYYVKVREYSDMESRDVWEYQLNLSTAETRQLLRHAWEIGATRFDYWFFDENCSYMILRLLDVARPGLRVSQRFPLTAIPVDTVKGVVDVPGLVTDITFRPAGGTELAHRASRLPPDAMAAAIAVADGRQTPASLGTAPLAIEQLEFADRLVSSAATLLGGVSPCRKSYDNYEILNTFPWLNLAKDGFGLAHGRRTPEFSTQPFDERSFLSIIGMAVKNAYSQVMTPEDALNYAQKLYDEQFSRTNI